MDITFVVGAIGDGLSLITNLLVSSDFLHLEIVKRGTRYFEMGGPMTLRFRAKNRRFHDLV